MSVISELKEKAIQGGEITKEEALQLVNEPLDELCKAADEIRKACCGNTFDLCTIINGKSGKCSEDCKYCAQSAHYKTDVATYPLLCTEQIKKEAIYNASKGVPRYAVVTSGRKLSTEEVKALCKTIEEIKKEVDISICVSGGLLTKEEFAMLKEAGVTRVHNNLESSRNYFPQVCTTHSYDEKINAIQNALSVGLEVCSGGIMGLGETMEDRIDMAIMERNLGVTSVPVNLLNPIPGTPYEHNKKLTREEMQRIIAIYRFLLPTANIRLAGGRGLLDDKGKGCFESGANAAISGDMLTTQGITIDTDKKQLEELGYSLLQAKDC